MDTPEALQRGIALVVTRRLQEAGISQNEASLRTGIPRTTLLRRLNGASPFSVTELAAVASLVGSTPSRLVFEAEGDAA